MTEAFVLHDPDGYRAYRHVGATHAQRIGPRFAKPRDAIEYAKALDAASDISPLRQPATRPAQEFPPAAARIGSPVGVVTEAEGG